MLKTIIYVDGYNLYYGLLRRSPYKWLDLFKLFADHVLDGEAQVIQVRYYTAPVLGKMCDDPDSPKRQRTYLQALRKTYPEQLVIIEGKMVSGRPYQRLVDPLPAAPHLKMVQVYDFNEKKTDVNLAADLISAAWKGEYEQAVLCSNDSDLEGALSSVRRDHPHLRLGLVAPVSIHDAQADYRDVAKDLTRYCDWHKLLNPAYLADAQLPEKIPGTALHKPEAW